MSAIYPFAALRPTPKAAAAVASVPYDVVNSDEARALAAGNPLSFLHVSRPEIDLAAGADPHADAAYEQAAKAFADAQGRRAARRRRRCRASTSIACTWGTTCSAGVAACFSIDEYDRDLIKKHEKTRPDKEDDRTRHMLAIGAQTGPVFLTYRASQDGRRGGERGRERRTPLFDFTAPDGVRHEVWQVPANENQAIVDAFAKIDALYIADGHHRAASARARRAAGAAHAKGAGEHDRVLAVAFPDNQMQVLPYNRVVKDLNGMTPRAFLEALEAEVHRCARAARQSPMRQGPGRDVPAAASGTPSHLKTGADALDVDVLETTMLAAAARHQGRAHRQAHRLRRRHPRHAGARAAREFRRRSPWRSRCTRCRCAT